MRIDRSEFKLDGLTTASAVTARYTAMLAMLFSIVAAFVTGCASAILAMLLGSYMGLLEKLTACYFSQ